MGTGKSWDGNWQNKEWRYVCRRQEIGFVTEL